MRTVRGATWQPRGPSMVLDCDNEWVVALVALGGV